MDMMDGEKECEIHQFFIQGTVNAVANYLLAITGTFGNCLVIFAILRTPQLRQRVSNFLLLSLAVSDLLVTVVSQPLFATFMSLRTFTD